MDTTISKVVAYLLSLVEDNALRNVRLTQMIYLIDWKSCLVADRQVTSIQWEVNNLGPFSGEILKAIIHNRDLFVIEHSFSRKINFISTKISLPKKEQGTISLDDKTRKIIHFVVQQTKDLGNESFISLIHSTYPVVKSDKFLPINLRALAIEYKNSRFWNSKSSSFDS